MPKDSLSKSILDPRAFESSEAAKIRAAQNSAAKRALPTLRNVLLGATRPTPAAGRTGAFAAHFRSGRPCVTGAFSRSPLSRAFPSFVGPILNGRSGSEIQTDPLQRIRLRSL